MWLIRAYVNATTGDKGNMFMDLVGELFSSKDIADISHSLLSVKQHISQMLLSLGLYESFYDVRNRVRYNSQAFGHLQVEVSSTVSWMSRLSLGLMGTDGLFQKVVCCTKFRKLLQRGRTPEVSLCPQQSWRDLT